MNTDSIFVGYMLIGLFNYLVNGQGV